MTFPTIKIINERHHKAVILRWERKPHRMDTRAYGQQLKLAAMRVTAGFRRFYDAQERD